MISGAVLLLRSLAPEASPATLRRVLLASARPLPRSSRQIGGGSLDLGGAIASLRSP